VCSDLERARRTAEAVHVACNLSPVHLEPLWRERRLGAWEGEVSADIDVAWPGLLDRWRAGEVVAIPDGEPWDDFVARVTEAVEAMPSEGTTLVVTHHGVFRALEAAYGLPFRKMGNCDGIELARS
jgi:broad specificity phosphatase PhoE